MTFALRILDTLSRKKKNRGEGSFVFARIPPRMMNIAACGRNHGDRVTQTSVMAQCILMGRSKRVLVLQQRLERATTTPSPSKWRYKASKNDRNRAALFFSPVAARGIKLISTTFNCYQIENCIHGKGWQLPRGYIVYFNNNLPKSELLPQRYSLLFKAEGKEKKKGSPLTLHVSITNEFRRWRNIQANFRDGILVGMDGKVSAKSVSPCIFHWNVICVTGGSVTIKSRWKDHLILQFPPFSRKKKKEKKQAFRGWFQYRIDYCRQKYWNRSCDLLLCVLRYKIPNFYALIEGLRWYRLEWLRLQF